MSDITLYGFPASSYTWSARLASEEKDINHDLEPIEFGSDAHEALNPFAKIPIMTHGDVILYETTAIRHYIDQSFDGPPLPRPMPPVRRACTNGTAPSSIIFMTGAPGASSSSGW